jgi:hypothetical protein
MYAQINELPTQAASAVHAMRLNANTYQQKGDDAQHAVRDSTRVNVIRARDPTHATYNQGKTSIPDQSQRDHSLSNSVGNREG